MKKKLSKEEQRWQNVQPNDYVIQSGAIVNPESLILLEVLAVHREKRSLIARDWSRHGNVTHVNKFITLDEAKKRFNITVDTRKLEEAKAKEVIQDLKGVQGENCNRTACQEPKSAHWYNSSTEKFYCGRCADIINTGSRDFGGEDLCHRI